MKIIVRVINISHDVFPYVAVTGGYTVCMWSLSVGLNRHAESCSVTDRTTPRAAADVIKKLLADVRSSVGSVCGCVIATNLLMKTAGRPSHAGHVHLTARTLQPTHRHNFFGRNGGTIRS